MRLFVVSLAWIATGLSGCGPKNAGDTTPQAPPRASATVPPSDDECQKFAADVQQAVIARDQEALGKLIDGDAILETAMAGIDVSPSARDGFKTGAKKSLYKEDGLINSIIKAASTNTEGDGYKLLHIHWVGSQKRALFRLLQGDGRGVNYHDLVLSKGPDGRVRFTDMYIYMSCELISQTFRRGFIQVAANLNRGILTKLAGWENEFVENLPKIQQITAAVNEGRSQDALVRLKELPLELQKDKTVLLIRVRAAQQVNDTEYAAAIDDFRRYHPGDAAVDFLSIDGFTLKDQFDKALGCIDRLDKALGGDPYLNVLRSGMHMNLKDLPAAHQDAEKAIAEEPTLQDGYWTLVTVTLLEQKFDETVKTLNALADKFHLAFKDLTTAPSFAEFVKSPQYREWLESREAK
jgi:hypothetical protein